MKKKTRSRSSNSLLLPFCVTICVCIIGATTNSWLFYNSFFRALTKLNEAPIATITFKYKTAQRKFFDRVVWDRLRQDSPLYNGDTIHTASLSEATIWFNDGNVMNLMENTMAQVFLTEDLTASVELEDGYATVDASDAENGMTLSSNGMQVAVKAGTSLSAGSSSAGTGSDNRGLSVQVLKGSADVRGADGKTLNVKQGEEVSVGQQGAAQSPSITVLSPTLNQKILYHTQGATDVHFSWTGQVTDTSLQISRDKDFKDILYTLNSEGINETDIKLENGSYYWKLDASESEQAKTGKIQVIQSLPPTPVTPTQNYSYSYRTRTPAVRIIWTESPYATTYRLEISKSPNMSNPIIDQRTATTSAIIATLTEGTYYWRVTPYYTLNKAGFQAPSEVRSFIIEHKGSLNSPELLIPAENGIVNIEESAKATSFSWKIENEATSYTIKIADNQNLRNPAVTFDTTENFYSLNNKIARLKEGHWYWGVSLKDSEGNSSPVSEIRSFYTMRGMPEQHTIEPADGYKCALTLLPDTKFTWKRNIPENFTSELQISTDPSFKTLVYTESVNSASLKGVNLEIGTYYWRLKSTSKTDDAQLVTPYKTLNILGTLDPAVLSAPGNRAIARETIPYKFTWKEVEGADYYKVTIYNSADNSLIYENVVYETEDNIDMFNGKGFIDKQNYRWNVQAFSTEIPGVASRRSGRLAEGSFNLIKLRPVEILSPAKGAEFDGIDAVLKPSYAKWTTVDKVSKAQFVLTKADEGDRIIFKIPTDEQMLEGNTVAPESVLIDTEEGIRPGRYEIVVYAETMDGIDISNKDRKYKGTFTVLPIDPLDSVTNLNANPQNLNAQYLRNKDNPRTITLSWAPVREATDYIVVIKGKKNKVLLQEMVNKPSYEIDFLKFYEEDKSTFAKGTFKWEVHAVRRIDSNKDGALDKILQEGPSADSEFKTEVPTPKKSKAKGASNPYGN